ncbi:MAG TPA: pyruvate kinase, partial [Alphaproteobacteria bacterium]
PTSSSYDSIRALFNAGANFFRLNFSHGTYDDHRNNAAIIHRLEQETGADIGIIADLQGPKLRNGKFRDSAKIPLRPGMRIRFDLDPALGDETRVSFPHPDIIEALEPGAPILMDDGNVGMKIVDKGADFLVAEVEYGSELSGNKGVNVPQLSIPVPALTEKDKKDLAVALDLGAEWIAQSFVQSAADVATAQALIARRAGLIAKIEKPAAVKNLKAILAQADAIMLARGDLGVEMPLEQVPPIQKVAIYEARLADKPIIIATQMLDSMRESPRPTRAEVSDVAQAVFDGANAVMLSGETSVGKYPVQTVEIMDRICREMESGTIHSLAMRAATQTPAQETAPFPHNPPAPPYKPPFMG